jgi:uncharacterized damage-inducible protein DinB
MFAQEDVITAFLLKWENSKNYLAEIAESMPAENYNYKPTEREMNFQEQLLHIRNNMIWLSTTYFIDENSEKFEKSDPKTKDEIIQELNLSFEYVASTIKNYKEEDLTTKVDFFAGPKSKIQLLNLLQDHVTHHRGQLIVYLNLNEIIPPKYTGW